MVRRSLQRKPSVLEQLVVVHFSPLSNHFRGDCDSDVWSLKMATESGEREAQQFLVALERAPGPTSSVFSQFVDVMRLQAMGRYALKQARVKRQTFPSPYWMIFKVTHNRGDGNPQSASWHFAWTWEESLSPSIYIGFSSQFVASHPPSFKSIEVPFTFQKCTLKLTSCVSTEKWRMTNANFSSVPPHGKILLLLLLLLLFPLPLPSSLLPLPLPSLRLRHRFPPLTLLAEAAFGAEGKPCANSKQSACIARNVIKTSSPSHSSHAAICFTAAHAISLSLPPRPVPVHQPARYVRPKLRAFYDAICDCRGDDGKLSHWWFSNWPRFKKNIII